MSGYSSNGYYVVEAPNRTGAPSTAFGYIDRSGAQCEKVFLNSELIGFGRRVYGDTFQIQLLFRTGNVWNANVHDTGNGEWCYAALMTKWNSWHQ